MNYHENDRLLNAISLFQQGKQELTHTQLIKHRILWAKHRDSIRVASKTVRYTHRNIAIQPLTGLSM